MKTFLKLLRAGALVGFLSTLRDEAVPAYTFAVVAALIAWTLVQYSPSRPRWQPKLRAALNRRSGATDVPLRFPANLKPASSPQPQLTMVE